MIIFGREVTASRWPWQVRTTGAVLGGPREQIGARYGWRPSGGMGRFGGGWEWCLGIEVGGSSTVLLNLIFGMVRITKARRCADCGRWLRKGQPRRGNWTTNDHNKHEDCANAR